jgi:hypothetical protein
MNKKLLSAFFLMSTLSLSISAQDAATGAVSQSSSQQLECMSEPSGWSIPDNEATVMQSDVTCPAGGKVLQMTVPVDYSKGQKGYPIGWPRMYFQKLKPEEADWSRWDNFEFMVMIKASRPDLAKLSCSLTIGGRPNQWNRIIKLKAQGEWMRITVPVAELKSKNIQTEKVPQIVFSITESDYADKDVIDLFIGGFNLTKSSAAAAAIVLTPSNPVKNNVIIIESLTKPAAWSVPDNEANVSQAEINCPDGGKALQMMVPVDYSSGQKGYPIGWPRMNFNKLTAEESDWSRWDNFEFMVMVKVSRPELRHPVCSLLIGSRPRQFDRRIKLNAQGEWLRVTIPISEIKGKGVPVEKIPQIVFSLSESDFADKDVVELLVGGFRLTCSILEIAAFSITDPALAPGAKAVKLNITVNGPEAEVKRGVPLILRQKDKALHREQLPLTKGAQIYELDISNLNLATGDYEILLFPDDAKLQKTASFKIVGSAW